MITQKTLDTFFGPSSQCFREAYLHYFQRKSQEIISKKEKRGETKIQTNDSQPKSTVFMIQQKLDKALKNNIKT